MGEKMGIWMYLHGRWQNEAGDDSWAGLCTQASLRTGTDVLPSSYNDHMKTEDVLTFHVNRIQTQRSCNIIMDVSFQFQCFQNAEKISVGRPDFCYCSMDLTALRRSHHI
jgi:hypothetical protein